MLGLGCDGRGDHRLRHHLCAVTGLCLFLAIALGACGTGPLGTDVVKQAQPKDARIAFDVVDLTDTTLKTVLAHRPPAFRDRFKEYVPPPELKIAVGDTVSVVIWESGADGLFGNSLTELEVPAGAAAQLSLQPPEALSGVPGLPAGVAPNPDLLATLFGGNVPALSTGAGGTASGAGSAFATTTPGAAPGITGNARSPVANAVANATASGAGQQQIEQLIDQATQSGRPGTRIPDQQVGTDGGISIPYAGRIKVAGLTPHEVEKDIQNLLGLKALDPQALVMVGHSDANSVAVSGEAIAGARVPLAPGGDRLLQVIAAAGGATTPVHDTFVQLTRDGVTAGVPMATLVADPAQDIYAQPGDVVTVLQRPRTFSVFGATGKNAAITFDQDHLSLSEALAKAGGLLDSQADPHSVFLFRYEPDSLVRALGEPIASNAPDGVSPVAYRLDLHKAQSYLLAKQFPVEDKDIIYVADAPTQQIYYAFQALQNITGPVFSGLITCRSTKC